MTEEEKQKLESLEQQIQEMKMAEQKNKLSARAIELGIPKSRIDEGFALTGSESETEVEAHLQKIAEHYHHTPKVADADVQKAAECLIKR